MARGGRRGILQGLGRITRGTLKGPHRQAGENSSLEGRGAKGLLEGLIRDSWSGFEGTDTGLLRGG